MLITVTGVLVDNQDKALKFYTEILGFQKKHDIPVDEEAGDRWLTVVSPERPDGVELLLEPNGNPVASTFQQAIFDQGIPAAMFGVPDVAAECERLKALGVEFTLEATDIGPAIMAIFKDTCGNLIQILQEKAGA